MTTKPIPMTNCPECNRRIPRDHADPELLKRFRHTLDCNMNTIASLRAAARHKDEEAKSWREMCYRDTQRYYATTSRYELANRRLREENNALRKKLHPGKC